MRTTLNELESSSTSSFARVHEIAVAGARLSDEISALRDSLSAGRLFDRVVTQAAGPAAREALRSPDGNPADDLARRYTMQREREVHEAVFKAADSPQAPREETAPVVPDVDNLDNVEFF
jgi:hypothetical protein